MITRPQNLQIGNVGLRVPIYFPSVSTVKTALPLLDYVGFLNALSAVNGQFLISAYDLARTETASREAVGRMLVNARESGVVVMVDSGNYESFWKSDQREWQQADFHRVLKQIPADLALGFDEQDPPEDRKEHLKLLLTRLEQDQAAAGRTTIIPIIHGVPSELPGLCASVARDGQVGMVAVPERRLGDGILARAKTVANIRNALNETGQYIAIHVLGTGNPISLALYSMSGADSFDGLEWCQVVVDHESALLFHLSQADFFLRQSSWGEAAESYQARVLAHNLEFYAQWMHRLRMSIDSTDAVEFCRANFPHRIFIQCEAALGWTART